MECIKLHSQYNLSDQCVVYIGGLAESATYSATYIHTSANLGGAKFFRPYNEHYDESCSLVGLVGGLVLAAAARLASLI